jgi:hypothetical protein
VVRASLGPLGCLLNFIQNPQVNAEVKELIAASNLPDPSEINMDTRVLKNPDHLHYCYTLSAFQRFICQPTLDLTEVGRRIGMIWQKIMIRREYSDSYVIDHKGTRHTIGDATPVARSVRLHLTNTPSGRAAYNRALNAKSMLPTPANSSSMVDTTIPQLVQQPNRKICLTSP